MITQLNLQSLKHKHIAILGRCNNKINSIIDKISVSLNTPVQHYNNSVSEGIVVVYNLTTDNTFAPLLYNKNITFIFVLNNIVELDKMNMLGINAFIMAETFFDVDTYINKIMQSHHDRLLLEKIIEKYDQEIYSIVFTENNNINYL